MKQKYRVAEVRQWKDRILTDKAALLAVETHSAGEIETADQRTLRHAIERHWGLSELRANVLQLLDRLDAAMESTLAELKARRDRGLTALAAGVGTGLLLSQVLVESQPEPAAGRCFSCRSGAP
jgi:hypothetical protein